MRSIARAALAAFAITAPAILATAAHASILLNGGFEAPVQGDQTGTTITPGNEPAGFVWEVEFGSVDVADLPFSPFVLYSAFEGEQALDLNGNNRGGIAQSFPTTPGTLYTLTFAYADNPFEGGTSTASIQIRDNDTQQQLLASTIAHSTSTNTPGGADWTLFSDTFIATGTSARIQFDSTSASNTASGGILLDAVRIAPACVPDLTTTGTTNGIPDGVVNGSDFTFYLSLFASNDSRADLTTTGTTNGIPDGIINGSDFTYFLSLFAAGCP